MPPLDPFSAKVLAFIERRGLISPGEHVLAAVSGGADSTALLHILHSLHSRIGYSLTVIHFDHRLRGEASTKDRLFVEKLSGELGLAFYSGNGDIPAYRSEHKVSLEMAARALRHQFFREAMERLGGSRLALGHTASDQAEEVLLRLFRGAGPPGLAGMSPKTAPGIIRPLLEASRDEILGYIHRCGLSFREDASNNEEFCQRNFLRLRIFPLLAGRFHDKAAQVLGRHADLARDEEDYWATQVEANWRPREGIHGEPPATCLEEGFGRIVIDCAAINALHPALQRRMLRFAIERLLGSLQGFYSVHVEMLRELCSGSHTSSSSSAHLPRGMQAFRSGSSLALTVNAASAPEEEFRPLLLTAPGVYHAPDFTLRIYVRERSKHSGELPASSGNAARNDASCIYMMDADQVNWPLTVRCWKPGDRFRPLGLHGSKKLQDFFTDLKIPRSARGRRPLLCDPEKICAVLGCRLDDRVKIGLETARLLVVEFTTNSRNVPPTE